MTRRYDAAAEKIKRSIDEGSVGRIRYVYLVYRDAPTPPIEFLKTSPILYYDNGIHYVDMAVWLLKEKPNLVYLTFWPQTLSLLQLRVHFQVYCIGHAFDPKMAEIGDDDTGVIVMKFASGTVASIELSRVSNCGNDMRYAIHGETKSVYSEALSVDGYTEATSQGLSRSPFSPSWMDRMRPAFREQMLHFHDCIIS